MKQYDKTVKFPALYLLSKPKQKIGFTLFKDELLAQYFQDIKEHCNRQIVLSPRFERNKECCFSIKKLRIVGEQNVLTEIINLRHCEVYSLYKNRYILPQNVEFLREITKCSAFTPNCGYDNSTVMLIGDVFCPGKYCFNREKCESVGGYVTTRRSI